MIIVHNHTYSNIDGSAQDYSDSIANALALLQSCTKPSNYDYLSANEATLNDMWISRVQPSKNYDI